ncbi:unnamed protein product [Fraxinus pennsylvanica]|uniref:Wax synthase domain-containing protein n=1 Tax=Fraxinus pennsylvanica TaxID=56036 RepID=A0AAD1YSQ1_9LAMI|nr:unnamed protein product [Fraxinus pennsylvanica]
MVHCSCIFDLPLLNLSPSTWWRHQVILPPPLPLSVHDPPSPPHLHPHCWFALKGALLAIIARIYDNMESVYPCIVFTLYCCQLYLALEVILAITAVPVRAILGQNLKPQFNEPYLATSLQDSWGCRWNLMVSSILRPAVYQPVQRISTRILGSKWARPLATLVTFLVSGLMHEVIYYYLSRVYPTWEVTRFFVLQGICGAFEIAVKKALGGRWQLHRFVSGPMTVVFVGDTGVWLFLPQMIRHGLDKMAIRLLPAARTSACDRAVSSPVIAEGSGSC